MPKPMPVSIIDYPLLRARKAELGLYVRDLTRMTGASTNSVSAFFNGDEHLNLRTIIKLAAALRLKVRVEFVPMEEIEKEKQEK